MTEGIQKRNYDGNSEACRGCKSFYRTGDMSAPCDTCNYRKEEEKRFSTMTEQMYVISESQINNIIRCLGDEFDDDELRYETFDSFKTIRSGTLSSAIAEHNAGVIAELERAKSVGLEMVNIDKAIALIRNGAKK